VAHCLLCCKLLHPFIELAHLFRVFLGSQTRLYRSFIISVIESHWLILLRKFDLAGHAYPLFAVRFIRCF
jgi:hypothetical protein